MGSRSSLAPTRSLFNVVTRPDMKMLPSYTPEVLPGYELTPTEIIPSSSPPTSSLSPSISSYYYRSERMDLDLGPRKWGTRLPSYGKGGVVKGTVTIRSFKHVDKVVVSLLGKLNTSHVLNQIPTLSQDRMVINKTVELWSSKAPSSSNASQGDRFPFSLVLEADSDTAQPIPASGSVQLTRAQVYVAYIVRVDMYRHGIHIHEMLQTEVLYIPRTISHYCPPFIPEYGNEKRPQISESEWHSTELRLEHTISSSSSGDSSKSKAGSFGAEESKSGLELWLPRELRYPSGRSIPFILSFPTALACSVLEIESNIEIQLVRISTIQTRAGVVQQVGVVSRARIQSIPEQGPVTMIRGTIDTGEPEKEFSWNFGSLTSLSYEIRATFNSTSAGSVWKITQGIELTTHQWRGDQSVQVPSLGSGAASRTGANIVHIAF